MGRFYKFIGHRTTDIRHLISLASVNLFTPPYDRPQCRNRDIAGGHRPPLQFCRFVLFSSNHSISLMRSAVLKLTQSLLAYRVSPNGRVGNSRTRWGWREFGSMKHLKEHRG